MSDIQSWPYRPDFACERCCFGSGDHAEFCPKFIDQPFIGPSQEPIMDRWSRIYMKDRRPWIDDYFDGEFHSNSTVRYMV